VCSVHRCVNDHLLCSVSVKDAWKAMFRPNYRRSSDLVKVSKRWRNYRLPIDALRGPAPEIRGPLLMMKLQAWSTRDEQARWK
jgi:hypothetical protein